MSTSEAELRRWQDRATELEDELRRERRRNRSRGSRYDDAYGAYGDYSDVLSRKTEEISALVRGIVRAGLEGFRVIADSASEFSEDVLDRNTADPYEYPRDAAQRLPGDIVRGFSNAIDHGLDAPRRAVERFDRTYREEPRRRPRRRSSARDAFESIDDPMPDWSTSALRAEARTRHIENPDSLDRAELLSALTSSGGTTAAVQKGSAGTTPAPSASESTASARRPAAGT